MNNIDLTEVFYHAWIMFIPFLLALCVHEYCHGVVAARLGDPTAKLMGRLTLNPMAHADPIGTFLLPLSCIFFNIPLFFGWAKPVPVNSRNLKNERVDLFWIALAGPASNLIMAFLGALAEAASYRIPNHHHEFIGDLSKFFITINLSLAIFNLIPVHPLDGGKIFAIFLSDSANRRMEELQPVFNIALFVLFLSGGFGYILGPPIDYTYNLFRTAAFGLFGMSL